MSRETSSLQQHVSTILRLASMLPTALPIAICISTLFMRAIRAKTMLSLANIVRRQLEWVVFQIRRWLAEDPHLVDWNSTQPTTWMGQPWQIGCSLNWLPVRSDRCSTLWASTAVFTTLTWMKTLKTYIRQRFCRLPLVFTQADRPPRWLRRAMSSHGLGVGLIATPLMGCSYRTKEPTEKKQNGQQAQVLTGIVH